MELQIVLCEFSLCVDFHDNFVKQEGFCVPLRLMFRPFNHCGRHFIENKCRLQIER